MTISGRFRSLSTAIGAVSILSLAACGDSATDAASAQSDTGKAGTDKGEMVTLPVEPINLAMAYAPLSAAPKAVPVCPWLSDASANAAVDVVMTTEPMVRRTVTSDQCRWNVNSGMALSVRAVPLAKAVDPASVQYNMDTPPVLKSQDGPGSAAVVLLDPTFDAENPRPFAFIFSADNRQFKISATGVRTSAERLRAVADEIAGALPGAAAVVEARDADPTLNSCVYAEAMVIAVFGGQEGTLTQELNMPSSSCRYKGNAGDTQINFTVGFGGDPLVPPTNRDPEYTLTKEFGADVYMLDTSEFAGYGNSSRVYQVARPGGKIRVDLTVYEEEFPEAAVEQILKNLIARTN